MTTDRASDIHAARVYLAQSRHFRQRARGWSFTLLQWAGNARRRAALPLNTMPAETAEQMKLF